MFKLGLIIGIIHAIAPFVATQENSVLKFSIGTAYKYSYEGISEVPGAGSIRVSGELSIIPLNQSRDTTQCRLIVNSFHASIDKSSTVSAVALQPDHFHFSKWFSFALSSDGTVSRVYYPPDEDHDALNQKKMLLGTLSSKLVISHESLDKGDRWAYRVNETGHEGDHVATYQAESSPTHLTFIKTRHTKMMEDAKHEHKKIVSLHRGLHVPHTIHIKEMFQAPTDVPPTKRQRKKDVPPIDPDYKSMPDLATTSEGRMTLIDTTTLDDDDMSDLLEDRPRNIIFDSVVVKPAPKARASLAQIKRQFNGNFTCIVKADAQEMEDGIPCFRNLLNLAYILDESELVTLAIPFLQSKNIDTLRIIVDVLGDLASEKSWQLLIDHVILAQNPEAELVRRALVHFVEDDIKFPQKVLDTLEHIVFTAPFRFNDSVTTTQVNNVATLVLGAVVHYMKKFDGQWSKTIAAKLHQRLGVHDPWHHRQIRSVLTEEDLQEHLQHKALHLLALGNARVHSTYECIKSYLNHSETHILLKTGAVHALSEFHEHEEAANVLLFAAMNPAEDENVRLAAISGYERHPYGGDVTHVIKLMTGQTNVTSISSSEHSRVRRGLKDVVARVWQGFQFKLATPSQDFKNMIGGEKLGASFGLVIKNVLDIEIAPMKGHVKVDIRDEAFATFHLGVIGTDLDFFRAKLCFQGHMEYDLNILKEFGFETVQKFADLYNKDIPRVVSTVKKAVDTFTNIINDEGENSPSEILDSFVDTLVAIPKNATKMCSIGKRMLLAITKYADLPPAVEKMRIVVLHVMQLFNDIKSDVMALYDSVIDMITVHVPWAWEEIITSITDIGESFPKITIDPKTSITNIGRSVFRMGWAFGVLINAKNEIMENNLFLAENRPYWWPIQDQMDLIWLEILDAKDEIVQTTKWVKTANRTSDEVAEKFLGANLTTVKEEAMNEILAIVLEEFEEPINKVKDLIQPFVDTANVFVDLVKKLKEGWTSLVNGYKEARSILEAIFGTKTHKAFPRKYLESESCGNGFWPTNQNGRYKYTGVDLEAVSGAQLVSPFNGVVKSVSTKSNRIIILTESIKNVEAIIENVIPRNDIDGDKIGAGDVIGNVAAPKQCSDPHVHLSLRKKGSNANFIDPSRYVERRELPIPKWIQECDMYLLKFMGMTVEEGAVLGKTDDSDETPEIPDAPSDSDLNLKKPPQGKRKTRTKRSLLGKVSNFTSSLGIPDKMNQLADMFKMKMNDLGLDTVLDMMEQMGLEEAAADIKEVVEKVQEKFTNNQNISCPSLDSLQDADVRRMLQQRNLSDDGSRENMIERLKQSAPKCWGNTMLPQEDVYCQFKDDCSGVSCCVDVKVFVYKYTVVAAVDYDPCTEELYVKLDNWEHTLKVSDMYMPVETEYEVDVAQIGMAIPVVEYKVDQDKEATTLYVTVQIRLCSKFDGTCLPAKRILYKAPLTKVKCTINDTPKDVPEEKENLGDFLSSSITSVVNMLGNVCEEKQEEVVDITQELRKTFFEWLLEKIENILTQLFSSEFKRFDICVSGKEFTFGPVKKTFIEVEQKYPLGGFVTVSFGFGLHGYYGASFQAHMCLVSMKANAVAKPQIGSSVSASLFIGIALFDVGIEINGKVLTTVFPATAEIHFNKFPLDIRIRLDMELIPLIIEMRGIVKAGIPFTNIKGEVFNQLLWDYQSPSIKETIFNINDAKPDDSAPDFSMYDTAEESPSSSSSSSSSKTSPSKRGRRSVGSTNQCTVYQIVGLDYTEPAFQIELAVNDDVSEVQMTYSVGTFKGGSDVVNNEPMGGSSAQISKVMPEGKPLYFTVTATNSMGLSAHASCELETYDMTEPFGRISPEYRTTSNPTVLHGSSLVLDDSPIIVNEIGIGYGRGEQADHLLPWHQISDVDKASQPHSSSTEMEHFSAPQMGALVYSPFKTLKSRNPEHCASECLSHPTEDCQSFNYDYGTAGTCELLKAVENKVIKIHKKGTFHHFERKGLGHVSVLKYPRFDMQHNQVYFINNYLESALEYRVVITGEGVLFDSTPPQPGPIQNIQRDVWVNERCESFIPDSVRAKCVGQTPINNVRYLTDGPGSATVFNGDLLLVDLMYTRANKMVAANWDGIRENETGILIYEWGVGYDHCIDDIHEHRDPHSHIADVASWTHQGVIHPVLMPDGIYHVSVRALNDVEYGGPMALVVCHSTPYIIDTSPPVIYRIYDLAYDWDTLEVGVRVNARDDESDIMRTEFGLGRNKRNTALLAYTDIENPENITYAHRIEDGVPAWVRIRVTNNVKLRDSDHSDVPIMVDFSPPEAGKVEDGNIRHVDWIYQSSTTSYCGTWEGFYDEQSGIGGYYLSLGTVEGGDDVVSLTEISPRHHDYCWHNLNLAHMQTYYLTVSAYNGGLQKLNVSLSSDGVMVDETAPEEGLVKDGIDPDKDMEYSSDAATVTATVSEFTDPESGIDKFKSKIFRLHNIAGSLEQLIHIEDDMSSDTTSLTLHHFHFHHNDDVRVTFVATNGARDSTTVSSDGYKVDLTDPQLLGLVDGKDINRDPEFQSSTSTLSVAWRFEDKESGIDRLLISAYELYQGKRVHFYPANGDEETVAGTENVWEKTGLNLQVGRHYSVRVTAVNGAGLSTVHDTTGVIIDSTPPQMIYVHALAKAGQSEEKDASGDVIHNDPSSLPASWAAHDSQSGVLDYVISVGTSPGATNVLAEKSMGLEQYGIITGLSLQVGSYYYVNAYAVNGADLRSASSSSSRIKMVKADVTGLAYDGPGAGVDVDYQLDTATLTVTFSGFESEAHGISHFDVSVGTKPGLDDVVPYSSQGLIVHDEYNAKGVGGSGFDQLLVELNAGEMYYTNVRAITGYGKVLETSTDGLTPDTTSPSINITSIQGLDLLPTKTENKGAIYVRSVDPFVASWEAGETESVLQSVTLALGSFPGGNDIAEDADVSRFTALPNNLLEPSVTQGTPIYLSLAAKNNLGLMVETVGREVVEDTIPPNEGIILCPQYVSREDLAIGVTCKWNSFRDEGSGISAYLVAMGTREGDDSIASFTRLTGEHEHFTIAVPDSGGAAVSSYPVVVTLMPEDGAGNQLAAYSSKIWVDHSSPEPGWVIELPDIIIINDTARTMDTVDCELVDEHDDATCQRSLTQVKVAWEEFTDDTIPMERYEIALGTTAGGTQIKDFIRATSGRLYDTVKGVDLSDVRQVFATVKGYNKAGLFNAATSNGVWISRISAGLPPLKSPYVNDGDEDVDLDFQKDNNGLYASWDFSGDPCPITKFEWEVKRSDGLIVSPMENVPDGVVSGMVDGMQLKDGETYYVIVRGTNELGHVMAYRSDGVTVQLEPLIPGTVRDGDIIGSDVNYWPYTDHLSANWDGFGRGRDQLVNPNLNANEDLDVESSDQQTVAFYEVAMGTDRRYETTRDNIHPFVDVGLNTTWTFQQLDLVPFTAVYYITVRAHSLSTTTTDVTSNGVKVGFAAKIPKLGELSIQKFLPSTTDLLISWSHFEFIVPLKFYMWSVGTSKDALTNISCTALDAYYKEDVDLDENLAGYFDIVQPTQVYRDTAIEAKNLKLIQGEDYTALILAVDESGGCALVTADFTVDITPPHEGAVCIGDGTHADMPVWYTPSTDDIDTVWSGYADEESGIEGFTLGLYSASSCDSPSHHHKSILTPVELDVNETSYSFFNLGLERASVYFIHLTVRNNAGLEITTVSPPILIDEKSPQPGSVKDGDDFLVDRVYQSSTSVMEGRIIYIPTPDADPCPPRRPLENLRQVKKIRTDHVVNVDKPASAGKVKVRSNKAKVSGDQVELTLEKDEKKDEMQSGAVDIDADIGNGGTYKFSIKTGHRDFNPVTSIAFLPGYKRPLVIDFLRDVFGENITDAVEEVDRFGAVIEKKAYASDAQLNIPTKPTDGFGFQIYSGVPMDKETIDAVVMWNKRDNETSFGISVLDFDPSEDFHIYKLAVNEEGVRSGPWHVTLHIDGKAALGYYGVNPLKPDYKYPTRVQLSMYTRHVIPVSPSEGGQSSTTSTFRDITFPPSSSALCRYGEPFWAGDQAIVEIHAGLGSEPGLDDEESFRKVYEPCVPCVRACDADICQKDCGAGDVQDIPILLDNLFLSTNLSENQTLPSPHYLTVVGKTASGREVRSSSNGVYIDVTPPVVSVIRHLDLAWGDFEPIKFQGQNHTLAVYWEAEDLESQITGFEWAISSSPSAGVPDIQNFTSVGLEKLAKNEDLGELLEDEMTYYVTVRAQNGAGLYGTATSDGVGIILAKPNVSSVATEIEDSDPLPANTKGKAVKSDKQDKVGFGWGNPDKDQAIEGIYVEIGTGGTKPDVLPKVQVAYNSSGNMEISSSGMSIGGQDYGAPPRVRRKRAAGGFQMEPGRIIQTVITACNKGHNCDAIPTDDIVFVRDQDSIAAAVNGTLISSIDGNITITIQSDIEDGVSLITGPLSESDMTTQYTVEGSTTFKPYIVDPAQTQKMTNRLMKNRIKSWEGSFFYMTTIPGFPIDGGITITLPFDKTIYPDEDDGDSSPRIVTWCAEEEFWTDVSRSCQPVSDANLEIDWSNGILAVKLCNPEAACEEAEGSSGGRRKRSTSSSFTGPSSMGVSSTLNSIPNTPPSVTSPSSFFMDEDEGKAVMQLTASDSDGDDFYFVLIESSNYYGEVAMSSSGLLEVTPLNNFAGKIPVTFQVKEIQYLPGIEPLTTTSTINIVTREVNDIPQVMILEKGTAVTSGDARHDVIVKQNLNNQTSNQVTLLLAAFDIDASDDMTILVQPGLYGNTDMSKVTRDIAIKPHNCSLSWYERYELWEHVEEDVLQQKTPLSLPEPCNTDTGAPVSEAVEWALLQLVYTPDPDFHGVDVIKASARDWSGSSSVVTIEIYVQETPCDNGAECQGPIDDKDCKGKDVALGFLENDYSCLCPVDYTGVYCQTEIDDCAGAPCPTNFTCLDGVAEYNCTCEREDWPCAGEILKDWHIVLIIVLPTVAGVIIVGLIIGLYVRKRMKKTKKVSDSRLGLCEDEYEEDKLKKGPKPNPLLFEKPVTNPKILTNTNPLIPTPAVTSKQQKILKSFGRFKSKSKDADNEPKPSTSNATENLPEVTEVTMLECLESVSRPTSAVTKGTAAEKEEKSGYEAPKSIDRPQSRRPGSGISRNSVAPLLSRPGSASSTSSAQSYKSDFTSASSDSRPSSSASHNSPSPSPATPMLRSDDDRKGHSRGNLPTSAGSAEVRPGSGSRVTTITGNLGQGMADVEAIATGSKFRPRTTAAVSRPRVVTAGPRPTTQKDPKAIVTKSTGGARPRTSAPKLVTSSPVEIPQPMPLNKQIPGLQKLMLQDIEDGSIPVPGPPIKKLAFFEGETDQGQQQLPAFKGHDLSKYAPSIGKDVKTIKKAKNRLINKLHDTGPR